jgi:hypothetical protein
MVLIMGDIINVNQPKNLKTKVVKVQQGWQLVRPYMTEC